MSIAAGFQGKNMYSRNVIKTVHSQGRKAASVSVISKAQIKASHSLHCNVEDHHNDGAEVDNYVERHVR